MKNLNQIKYPDSAAALYHEAQSSLSYKHDERGNRFVVRFFLQAAMSLGNTQHLTEADIPIWCLEFLPFALSSPTIVLL
jgi:hypothetical protein